MAAHGRALRPSRRRTVPHSYCLTIGSHAANGNRLIARSRTSYGNSLAAACSRTGPDGDVISAVGMAPNGDGVIPAGSGWTDIVHAIFRGTDGNGIISPCMAAYGSRIRSLGSGSISYFYRMISSGMPAYRYRVRALGRGIGPHLHRMVSLGMASYGD